MESRPNSKCKPHLPLIGIHVHDDTQRYQQAAEVYVPVHPASQCVSSDALKILEDSDML